MADNVIYVTVDQSSPKIKLVMGFQPISTGASAISQDPGNALERRADGLFVEPLQYSTEKW